MEVPDWVAADEALLGLVHSLVVEQCRLGPGYPVALKEGARTGGSDGSGQAVFRGTGRRGSGTAGATGILL